jgi:DNA topoisomerase I
MHPKAKKRSIQKYIKAIVTSDPVESAEAIGLRYVTNDLPGIQRKPAGKSTFAYFDPNGDRIRNPEEIRIIRAIESHPLKQV